MSQSLTLAPRSRQTVLVDSLAGLENTAVPTVVTSLNALPLAVERAMYSTSPSQPGVVWAAGTDAAAIRIP